MASVTNIDSFPVLREGAASTAVRGLFCGFNADGEPLTDFPANENRGPIVAVSTVPLEEGDCGREVVLLFEGGDASRPIIAGILQAPVCVSPETRPEGTASLKKLFALMRMIRHDPVTGSLIFQNGGSRIILMDDGTVRVEGRRIISAADENILMRAAYIDLN
jgi:hypothetical protein